MTDAEFHNWEGAMRRMLPALLTFVGEEATAAGYAHMYRRLYEALLSEGFSPNEALLITSGQRPTASASGSSV